MDRWIDDSKTASMPASDQSPDIAIDRELLHRALGSPLLNRLLAFIPLTIIVAASFQLESREFLWCVVALQAFLIVPISWAARKVGEAIAEGRPAGAERALWLFAEAAGGALWGLMLVAIADAGTAGFTISVIAVTIVATLIATGLIGANAPGLSMALMIGFSASAIPVAVLYFDEFGPFVLLAIVALPPAMFWPVRQLLAQARKSLRSEFDIVKLTEQLSAALEHANFLSHRDSLTGLHNRRAFEEAAYRIRRGRDAGAAAILLFDLDRFKAVNDRHGHGIGDAVLRAVADSIETVLGADLGLGEDDQAFARWGGEEFIVALAPQHAHDAKAVAEQLRQAIAQMEVAELPAGENVSASFGIAFWYDDEALHETISRADRAMYAAKKAGRDRTRVGRRPAASPENRKKRAA